MKRSVSKEDILKDIKRVYEEHGSFTQPLYEKVGKYKFWRVTEYFGGVKNVHKIMGWKWHNHNVVDKDDLVDDILRVYNEQGEMKKEIYVEFGKYSCNPIRYHFGTFNKMLKELGLKVNIHTGEVSKEEVISKCLDIYNKYGHINATFQRKESGYSQRVIDKLFGGFNGLLEEMGLPANKINQPREDQIKEIREVFEEYGFINKGLIDEKCTLSYIALSFNFGGRDGICKAANICPSKWRSDKFVSSKVDILANEVSKILGEAPIREHSWEWLVNHKTGRRMYIDLYFPENNLALEYDGEQHFEYTPFFHESYEDFEDAVERDKIKEELLRENGVNLIRFDYRDRLTKELIENKLFAMTT